MNYNDQLRQLHLKISGRHSLEAKLEELKHQQAKSEERAEQLRKAFENEQQDVDRLERVSLASIFYSVTGKKDEALSKEKAEAHVARLKYDSAVQYLNSIREDRERIEAQLHEIYGLEQEYNELMAAKIQTIKASGSAEVQRIFRLDEEISQLQNLKKEISEAVSAGEAAMHTADSVIKSLDSAETWGTVDFIGGGLFSDIAKHNHLDDAQAKIYQLQEDLRRFKTELADVKIELDTQISIEGFLKFADIFFDNIFTDMAVMDKIRQSQSNIQNTKKQTSIVVSQLNSMAVDTDAQIAKLEAEKNDLIASAAI